MSQRLKLHFFFALPTALLVIIFASSISDNSVLALQQVAGEISVTVQPGDKSSFQWGLLSDSDQDIRVQLRAEGEGAELLSFPDSILLEPGKFHWVGVEVTVPAEHPGSIEVQPSLFATEQGEQGGTTVVNIQMQKVVKMRILPNPDPSLASKSSMPSTTEYTQIVRVGDQEVRLLMQSSSEVTGFEFDEASKTVSFKVSGAGTASTVIHLDSVLKGPYGVSIDGEPTSNYESIISEDGKKESLKINYEQSSHTITIAGASVVPEFSVSILMTALVLMAVIASLGLKDRIGRNSLHHPS